MEAEEPALALDAVERRVPFDRLAHAGDGAHDERVEAAPDVAFPARHGRDVGLYGGVAVGLRDLRVAACEEGRLRGHRGALALGCGGFGHCIVRQFLRRGFVGLRADDLATGLCGLAAFAATRLAAAFFAIFADFLDVLLATTESVSVALLVIGPSFWADFRGGESALPEPGHLACPVDQRGQGEGLRAIVRVATFVAVAHQPGLLQRSPWATKRVGVGVDVLRLALGAGAVRCAGAGRLGERLGGVDAEAVVTVIP